MTPLNVGTAQGIAIHIGLDKLDPAAYEGWDGALAACENDAVAMEEVTSELGYRTRTLLSAAATAEAVLGALRDAAASSRSGDICVVTYSGHGGQFADLNADEDDRLDETWLLHDREVLDDEIRLALSAFAPGVRIVVLSDSCHSGTVVRATYERVVDLPMVRSAYERVRLPRRPAMADELRLRGAPPSVQERVLAAHRADYRRIRSRTPVRDAISIAASVILISGCQDNQESVEANGHGVFTAALLSHWRSGFRGDYRGLHEAIARDLLPTQSPNFFTDGRTWRAFERQVPFTISPPDEASDTGDHAASSASSIPSIEVVTTESNVVVVKFSGDLR